MLRGIAHHFNASGDFQYIDREIIMANIDYTGNRATKWMRYIARALALIWAVWWTFFALVSGAGEGLRGLLANAPNALPELVFLVSVAIAWRWEAVGGIMLLLCALGTFFFFHIGRHLFMHLTFVLPPVVAGFLFLASWRKSRTLGMPQNSA
ncbi:hypothetical protein KAX00_01415 [bacterium]|nr:hypothetical protein [bacterium]